MVLIILTVASVMLPDVSNDAGIVARLSTDPGMSTVIRDASRLLRGIVCGGPELGKEKDGSIGSKYSMNGFTDGSHGLGKEDFIDISESLLENLKY